MPRPAPRATDTEQLTLHSSHSKPPSFAHRAPEAEPAPDARAAAAIDDVQHAGQDPLKETQTPAETSAHVLDPAQAALAHAAGGGEDADFSGADAPLAPEDADRFAMAFRPSWEPLAGDQAPAPSSLPRAPSMAPRAASHPPAQPYELQSAQDELLRLRGRRTRSRAVGLAAISVLSFGALVYWGISSTTTGGERASTRALELPPRAAEAPAAEPERLEVAQAPRPEPTGLTARLADPNEPAQVAPQAEAPTQEAAPGSEGAATGAESEPATAEPPQAAATAENTATPVPAAAPAAVDAPAAAAAPAAAPAATAADAKPAAPTEPKPAAAPPSAEPKPVAAADSKPAAAPTTEPKPAAAPTAALKPAAAPAAELKPAAATTEPKPAAATAPVAKPVASAPSPTPAQAPAKPAAEPQRPAAAATPASALAAAPAAPKAPDPVRPPLLMVRAVPEAAQLWLDGQRMTNPFDTRLPLGSKHKIEAKQEGYETSSQTIRIESDARLTITLRRENPAPEPNIKTQPPDGARGAGFVTSNPY